MLSGIDISQWQAATPDLADVDFVFVRATDAGVVDSRYGYHAAHVRAAGKVLGAYAFWQDVDEVGGTIPNQVSLFLATAHDADLLALDLEGLNANTAGLNQARQFIELVHQAGRQIGLYHSLSGYPDLGQDWNWVAYWNAGAPPIPWTFWQTAGSGVDHDQFNGDSAALAALVGGDPVSVYEKDIQAGAFSVPAGKTCHAYKLDAGGFVRTGAAAASGDGRYDAHFSRVAGTAVPSSLLHVTSGLFNGFYVDTAEVAETPDPPAPTFTAADVAAAKSEGYAEAKAKAISTVQAI